MTQAPYPQQMPPQQVTQHIVVQKQSNALGMIGFILSIVGFFTCGLLSPIGLLLSFIGMFKSPRTFAVVGFFLNLLGSGLMIGILLTFGLAGILAFLGVQQGVTYKKMYDVTGVIKTHYDENQALPSEEELGELVVLKDAFDNNITYVVINDTTYTLSSPGIDGEYDLDPSNQFSDDIIMKVDVTKPGFADLSEFMEAINDAKGQMDEFKKLQDGEEFKGFEGLKDLEGLKEGGK